MHVEKLNSIEKLEKLNAKGIDVCLVTSLFEYGLLWIEGEEEILFIHPIHSHEGEQRFDRTSFANDTDVYSEFDWVDWESFFATNGTSKEKFDKLSLSLQINDIYREYGFMNVFGESYWSGFAIPNEEE